MKTYLKESLSWVLIAVPYIYLTFVWKQLPDKVPTHFNFEGVADGWSGKNFLFFIPAGLGVFIYLLMLAIPFIDPKKKIQEMGDKYFTFRLMLTFFFSFFSLYLLYASKEGGLKNPNLLIALIGMLIAMFGNYFQTVRSNYFIGIRTPWTLQNETVWKKTHHLAGRLWMAGGILIILLSFLISNNRALSVTFGVIVGFISLIPIVFSYTSFRKEKTLNP